MSTFDPILWRTRADKRLSKALCAGKSNALQVHVRDSQCIADLETLVAWCQSRRIEVVFGRASMYEIELKRITVCGRLSPERQLFNLAHECGHYLIGRPRPGGRFDAGWHVEGSGARRSTLHRVDVVDEELGAWARGLRLLQRLKVTVDMKRYNRVRAEYVRTYLKWALKVDGYGTKLNSEDDDG